MTDVNGNIVTYTYDELNRRSRTLFADGSSASTTYDAVGRRVAETDQAGLTTQFGYDALGRLVSVTDALDQVTRYSYDARGNQLTQSDANGNSTGFGYDALGRRVRRTLPLGMSEAYAYNVVGNLLSKTDFNGFTTTYEYDELNRLTARLPDPSRGETPVRFAYFPSGQRQRMEDASGVTTYTYDQRDRLLSKATPWGTLTYSYDAAGNLLSIRSSNANGVNVTYSYDELNRLAALDDQNLADGVTTYAYDNAGNLVSYRYPNFVQHDYTYDPLNRLTNLSVHKGFAPLAAYAYTLGAAGNRLAVSELSGRTVQYAYDDLYRLTGETIADDPNDINGAIGYTYDPVGNRLERTSTVAPVPAATYGYDANDRLLSDSYDANGNTVVSEGKSYAYDFENRLTDFNNGEVTMVYDGDGNRVAKTVAGVTTNYLVDDRNLTGYAQVLEEIVGGVVQRQYTYGLDLVSQKVNTDVFFYHYDGIGSVRSLGNISGVNSGEYIYDAFGSLLAEQISIENDYLFIGEFLDRNIESYYLRARFYNQEVGRFTTTDTWVGRTSDPRTLHKYLYAANNPVMFIDPSGQFFVTFVVATATILGALSTSSIVGSLNNRNGVKQINLKEGDVVLRMGIRHDGDLLPSAASVFTALTSMGPYSHIGIVSKVDKANPGESTVLQAYPPGGRYANKTTLRRFKNQSVYAHLFRVNATEQQRSAAVRYAKNNYTKSYDSTFSIQDSSAYYCSEFVWQAYHDGAGVDISGGRGTDLLPWELALARRRYPNITGEQLVTPNDIFYSLTIYPVFTNFVLN